MVTLQAEAQAKKGAWMMNPAGAHTLLQFNAFLLLWVGVVGCCDHHCLHLPSDNIPKVGSGPLARFASVHKSGRLSNLRKS